MPALSERPGRPANSVLQDLWRQRLQRFERSGLSVGAFCTKEGVSLPSFYAWRRRLRQPSAEQPARPVVVPGGSARLVSVSVIPAAGPVEILLPGGIVLRLTPGCDLDFVRSLVATLGERPC